MNAKQRWQEAVYATRRSGVVVRQNVMECCRGCVSPEKLGMTKEHLDDGMPYAWTYGGQGNANSWVERSQGEFVLMNRQKFAAWNKRAFGRMPEPVEGVYFYHGNGGAEKVVEAFRAQGFEVEWNGDQYEAVLVKVGA